MISTEPLERLLTAPGARELGFEDPSLEAILTLSGQGRHIQAAERAQQLWTQEIYDTRTLGSYLFGVFVERGIASLATICDLVQRLLTQSLPFLGPSHKRERHLDGALRWLFDSIITQVRFHERQKDETWKKWNENALQAVHLQSLASCRIALASLDAALPLCRSRQPLLNLQSILEVLARESAVSSTWSMSGATQIPPPLPPADPIDASGSDDSKSSTESDDSDRSFALLDHDDDDDKDDDDKDDDDKDDDDKDDKDDKDDDDKDDDDKDDDDKDDKGKDTDKGSPGDDDDDSDKDADKDKDSAKDQSTDKDKDSDKEGDADETKRDAGAAADEPGAAGSAPGGGERAAQQGAAGSGGSAVDQGSQLVVAKTALLQELLDQLAGFVQLAEKQRYRRAAILYGQIRRTLGQFDATRFFPSLFADYLLTVARHAAKLKLGPAAGGEEDIGQEALRQLCQVDLRRFMAGSES